MKPMIQSKLVSLVALMREVMTSNPPWESVTSTMVMAQIRKKTIAAVSASFSVSWWLTPSTPRGLAKEYRVHIRPAARSAEADLFILIGCSSAIIEYASTNTTATMVIILTILLLVAVLNILFS